MLSLSHTLSHTLSFSSECDREKEKKAAELHTAVLKKAISFKHLIYETGTQKSAFLCQCPTVPFYSLIDTGHLDMPDFSHQDQLSHQNKCQLSTDKFKLKVSSCIHNYFSLDLILYFSLVITLRLCSA